MITFTSFPDSNSNITKAVQHSHTDWPTQIKTAVSASMVQHYFSHKTKLLDCLSNITRLCVELLITTVNSGPVILCWDFICLHLTKCYYSLKQQPHSYCNLVPNVLTAMLLLFGSNSGGNIQNRWLANWQLFLFVLVLAVNLPWDLEAGLSAEGGQC